MTQPRRFPRVLLPVLVIASGAAGAFLYASFLPDGAARAAVENHAREAAARRNAAAHAANRRARPARRASLPTGKTVADPVVLPPDRAENTARALAGILPPAPEPSVDKPDWPPLPPHGFPFTPPTIDDFARRVEHKTWWVNEFSRRIEVYRQVVPRDDYPHPDQVGEWLDELYDMAVPKADDEPWPDHRQRRKRRGQLMAALGAGFHASIHTILATGKAS